MEVDIKCKYCKRHLGKTSQSIDITIKCSNSKCKKDNDISIKFASDYIKTPKEKANE